MESKIKTVADAFAYTNRDIYVLQHLESLPQQDVLYMSAWYQRMVVTEALNKEANGGVEWQPNYGDDNTKYETWVWLKRNPARAGAGFVAIDTHYANASTYTTVGSRLCFKSKELVQYFNHQFSDLLKDTIMQL